MAYAQNVSMRLTNPSTGQEEDLYTKARDDSVILEDGSTLRGWIDTVNRSMAKHTLRLNSIDGSSGGNTSGFLTKEDLKDLYVDITIDKSTGRMVAERYSGAKTTLPVATKTATDLVVNDGTGLNRGHKFITLIYDDNSRITLDTAEFMVVYTGKEDGDNIVVSVDENQQISATLLDRSIGLEKLSVELQDMLSNHASLDDLPIAGEHLGLVKNGGNVEVESDGTMNAANIRFDMNDGITPPAGVQLTLAADETVENTTYSPKMYVVPRGTRPNVDDPLKGLASIDINGVTVLRVACGDSDVDDSDAMTYTWYVKNISGEDGFAYKALANISSKILDGTKSIFEVGKSYDVYCVTKGVGLNKVSYGAKSTNHIIVTITK